MAAAKCPNCGLEGDAGSYCEGCGTLLGAVTSGVAANDASATPEVLIPDGMPFGAQVTFSEPMWKGVASPMKIVFRAARDIYADVAVSVLNGEEELYRRANGCRPCSCGSMAKPFSFNVCPRMPGTPIELTARFECMRDGSSDPDVYEANFPVCVYDEQAHHINIDASTVVNGAGASVLQYKNSVGDWMQVKDRRFGPAKSRTLPLHVSLAATPRRLTLRRNGETIHLWALSAGETVVCGRNEGNDYMLRVFDRASGKADRDKSLVVSGRHFRFVLSGDRALRVADGGDASHPSSWGTSIGEMKVGTEGVVLCEGKHEIDIGTGYTPRGVLSLGVDVAFNEDRTLAGFFIAREDGLNERVVAVVRRSIPFAGGAFAWDGKRFLFNGKGIVPGVTASISGKDYDVCSYHQRKT